MLALRRLVADHKHEVLMIIGSLAAVKAAAMEWLKEHPACTCANPCCEVDIGIGYVDCGPQHCPEHGTLENQGIPSYRNYGDGSLYARDTVQGQPVGTATHIQNRMSD